MILLFSLRNIALLLFACALIMRMHFNAHPVTPLPEPGRAITHATQPPQPSKGVNRR